MQRARNQETTERIGRLRDELAQLGWYHSIELPDGRIIPGLQSIEQLRTRIAQYPVPEDLRGKRVLDIGAWDGWFSFEMERRGATVVAVDSIRQDKFLEAKRLLNSKAEYIVADVCQLRPRDIGYFDIVLFFGVLYHLKHPLLALERVCELTTDMACIESLVIDDPPSSAIPIMEFYEGTELGGQFDNWVGPNTACLLAFCRTAGFVGVELANMADYRAHVVVYRKWPHVERSGTGPELICVENTWTRNHEFSGDRDDYFTAWFSMAEPDAARMAPDCGNVFVTVGPYATQPVGVRNIGGTGWQANCKLPLGLSRGWHDVRIGVGESAWSNSLRIPIDLARAERREFSRSATELIPPDFEIAVAADGLTFERSRVRVGVQSCVSVWAAGLPDGARKADISLRLDGADLPAIYVSHSDKEGLKQINATLPPNMEPGEYLLAINLRGVESRPVSIQLFRP
jgi:tRNA (mo5U34)-methyltransferase